MDLLQLMEERYSLRAYDARPVEEEKLQRVLEAGRIAPTAKNMQPWKVYVVEKEKDLALLRSLTPCAFDAPVVLMFCGIEAESAHSGFDGHSWDQMDTTIVMTHMMLEAQAQGLGTCIVGWFDSEAVQKAFQLPEEEHLWCLLPMGYPAADAKPGPQHDRRKEMSQLEAQAQGLGTCIVGWFDSEAVQKAFQLPEEEHLWCLLPMGYPAADAKPGPQHDRRKEMSQLVTRL